MYFPKDREHRTAPKTDNLQSSIEIWLNSEGSQRALGCDGLSLPPCGHKAKWQKQVITLFPANYCVPWLNVMDEPGHAISFVENIRCLNWWQDKHSVSSMASWLFLIWGQWTFPSLVPSKGTSLFSAVPGTLLTLGSCRYDPMAWNAFAAISTGRNPQSLET